MLYRERHMRYNFLQVYFAESNLRHIHIVHYLYLDSCDNLCTTCIAYLNSQNILYKKRGRDCMNILEFLVGKNDSSTCTGIRCWQGLGDLRCKTCIHCYLNQSMSSRKYDIKRKQLLRLVLAHECLGNHNDFHAQTLLQC